MGSYNYLGFAETEPNALKTVNAMLRKYGTGVCSTRQEMGKDNKLLFLSGSLPISLFYYSMIPLFVFVGSLVIQISITKSGRQAVWISGSVFDGSLHYI